MLLNNKIFVLITVSLCSLYFVVTGIQFWGTKYMMDVLEADHLVVLIVFVLLCTTAPLAGVFTGSWLMDHLGGYKGKNLVSALKVCMLFGSAAFTFACIAVPVMAIEVAAPML